MEVKRKQKIKRQISQDKINSRMERPSMDIFFLVITLAIKQWNARNQRKDIHEYPKTQLDVGDAILLGTQQNFVIQ
jgi:hypothetical protein